MQNKFRGVMQSPVTPLKADFSPDLTTFEKVLDFHVRTAAAAPVKAAMRALGRDCGNPRAPLIALSGGAYDRLATQLAGCPFLTGEPRVW